jgi:hypothetical protein
MATLYEPPAGPHRGPPWWKFQDESGQHPAERILSFTDSGLRKAGIKQQTEAIIDFAELGPFIDLSLSCYSTGMRARISFRIAAAVVSEICCSVKG